MSKKDSDTLLHFYILIIDIMGSAVALLFAFLIRYGILYGISSNFDQLWILGLFLITTILINIAVSPTNRFTRRGIFAEFCDVLKRQLFICIITIVLLYLMHSGTSLSRLVLLYYSIISIIVIWLLRLLLKEYLIKVKNKQKNAVKTLLVTTGERIERIQNGIIQYNDVNREVLDVVNVVNASYREIIDFVTRNEVDEVFVSIPNVQDKESYQGFITALVNMRIKVDLDIDQFELDIPGHKIVDQIGHFAVVSIAISTMSISRRFAKRLMDIIGGIVGLFITLIAFIILAPIIKLDSPGPLIFSQKRVGKNGRLFDFYKFRSMYADAESQKQMLMSKNEVDGLMFKMDNDPRITKVGKFIRKTSIDELPQFWNVLLGSMSLVGTRPPTVDEYEQYESSQKARLSMKPGITGLWQISGRSDIKDFNEVLKLDLKYIDGWSLGLDIKILLKTVVVVLTQRGSR